MKLLNVKIKLCHSFTTLFVKKFINYASSIHILQIQLTASTVYAIYDVKVKLQNL